MILHLLIAALTPLYGAPAPILVPPLQAGAAALLNMEQDPISGRTSAFAVLRGSNEGRLSIGCDPDRFRGLKVRLHSPAWFAPENLLTERNWVQYRFDEAQPHRSRWRAEDGDLTIGSKRRTRNFTRWMLASDRIIIRAEDVEGRELDYAFHPGAARPILLQMYQLCTRT